MNDQEMAMQNMTLRERLMLNSNVSRLCLNTLEKFEEKSKEKELSKLQGGPGSKKRYCTLKQGLLDGSMDHRYKNMQVALAQT